MKNIINKISGKITSDEKSKNSGKTQKIEINNLDKIETKSDEKREIFAKKFEEFSQKIQEMLDLGSSALKIAEEKTKLAESLKPDSDAYQETIKYIEFLQNKASEAFDKAEEMIKLGNSLLDEEYKSDQEKSSNLTN